jgi:hypothetical protein
VRALPRGRRSLAGIAAARRLRHPARGEQRPVRIAQQLAREDDEVGATVGDDRLRVGRLGDHPDGSGRDPRLAAYPIRERGLVQRAERDRSRRHRNGAARARVDQVDALVAQQPGQRDRLIEVPAAGHVVRRREPHEQRVALRPYAAHRACDLKCQPRAVLERAAPAIGAMVDQRREELVHEISVRAVDLDDRTAGVERAAGAVGERTNDRRDAGFVERRRRRIGRVERIDSGCDRRPPAGRERNGPRTLPRPLGRALPSGMRELRAPCGTLASAEACDPRELGDVLVLPNPQILRRDPSLGGNRDRLGEHERGTADGSASEVHDVPIVGETVGR